MRDEREIANNFGVSREDAEALGWPEERIRKVFGSQAPEGTGGVEKTLGNPSQIVTTWTRLSEVIGPVTWAWQGWLPNGMLVIVAGEPGSGKSALALQIAATFLNGDPWPDSTEYMGEIGKVLWCEAEAAQAINLERARAWNLPLDSLITPFADPLVDVRLDHLEGRKAVQAMAELPDVRFVVVDSLRGVHRRDENASETVGIVLWLAALARNTGKPFLLTHHLRKRGMMNGSAAVTLERLRGSSAIVQPARIVWAVDTPNPRQPEMRRLANIKNNLTRFPSPIGFQIDEEGVYFSEPPEPPRYETQVDRACDLLKALLAKGPRLSREIEEEARGAGISWPTMNRAKTRLGIVAVRKENCWLWGLPSNSV